MDAIEVLKAEILARYDELFYWSPLESQVKDAFLQCNRHHYVNYFYPYGEKRCVYVNEENLKDNLASIYEDSYLATKISSRGEILSSLSQPSLVLYMLNIAGLKHGDKVLEIGTASGWNAALISTIVGENGTVDTIEIDQDLVINARSNIAKQKIDNIEVHCADGVLGLAGKVFDVVIFTVGTYDIHQSMFQQVKQNGTLILILKNQGGGDTLYALKKKGDSFVSYESLPCSFVQIQGPYRLDEMQPLNSNSSIVVSDIMANTKYQSFWFGGYKIDSFIWRTLAFRSYLSVVDSDFVTYDFNESENISDREIGFGIYNKDELSIAIFQKERLVYSRNEWAKNRIHDRLTEWLRMGMPTLAAFTLEVLPKSKRRKRSKNECVVVRDESYFYFKYPNIVE